MHAAAELYTLSTYVDKCVEHKIFMFFVPYFHVCTTEQTILDDGTLREKERIQLMLYIAPFVNIVRRD